MILTRKPVAPATLAERLASVETTKAAALSVFDLAIADLTTAAAESEILEAEVANEIAALMEIADDAARNRADAETKAVNLASILSNGIRPTE